jgi:hypothetical protein
MEIVVEHMEYMEYSKDKCTVDTMFVAGPTNTIIFVLRSVARIFFFFFFFLGGGKEGNASCTVAPLGAVCGTPVRLASGSILPLDKSAARPTH